MLMVFFRVSLLLAGLLVLLAGSPAAAQDAPPALRVATQADGDVYVYHGLPLPPGYGVTVARRDAGADAFVPLTEVPLHAAPDGPTFAARIGGRYAVVAEAVGATSPQGTLLRLQTRRDLNLLLSFTYPEVGQALGRLFIDTTATPGQTVTYRLQPVDDRGEPAGDPVEATVALTPQRPAPPTIEGASHTGAQVTLRWTYPAFDRAADDYVIRFDVYRSQPGSDEVVRVNAQALARTRGATEFAHTFTVPTLGTTYALYVVAVDITGQASAPGEVLTYTVEDNVPPALVRDVRTRVLPDRTVEVTWPVSIEPDAAGYRVYRAPRSTGPWRMLTDSLLDVLQPIYVDTTTRPGRQYQYAVTAVDASGNESPRSNAASALVEDTEPPPPPAAARAVALDDGSVQVSWHVPAPAADLATYVVLRRRLTGNAPPPPNAFAQLNGAALRDTLLIDRGVAGAAFAEGAVYHYGVAAADSAGNVSDTAFVRLQIPDRTPPAAPGFLRATVEDGVRARLTWNASTSGDVTAYEVRRRVQPGPDADTVVARLGTAPRYTRDEDVVPGRTYVYHVVAIDSLGNVSPPSPADTLRMRDASPPPPVRNVQAQAGPDGVRLVWEAVPVADLAGYRVERAETATGAYVPAHDGLLAEPAWTDPGGNAGWWYRVRAVDTSGNEGRASTRTQAGLPRGRRP